MSSLLRAEGCCFVVFFLCAEVLAEDLEADPVCCLGLAAEVRLLEELPLLEVLREFVLRLVDDVVFLACAISCLTSPSL